MKTLRSTNLIFSALLIATVLFTSCKKDDDPTPTGNDNPTTTNETGQFTDARDGKVYNWVKIGDQTWMSENFAYKPDNDFWAYDNDENNVATYGYLYTLETATAICPDGWHVPTNDEWIELIEYLGGYEEAGNKMKEAGGAHWDSEDYGNRNITNSSGFTALPGGRFEIWFDEFDYLGFYGFWWTESGSGVDLTGNFQDIEIQSGSGGISVRYIKDSE